MVAKIAGHPLLLCIPSVKIMMTEVSLTAVVIEKDPKKLEALLALLKDKVLSKKDLALSPDVDLTELLKEVAATPDTPAMAISGVGK